MRLIWVAIHANMGSHIMKTTIEIADDLFERAQSVAQKEKTTFRSLTEQGLRIVLKEKQAAPPKRKWKPITRGGGFVTEDVSKISWERMRDEFIYPPRFPW
jgi:predicted transcriptional regulator